MHARSDDAEHTYFYGDVTTNTDIQIDTDANTATGTNIASVNDADISAKRNFDSKSTRSLDGKWFDSA